MSRLTDDELDALIQRFSPGRHPKVAAALAELKERRESDKWAEADEMTARRQAEADGEWRDSR